MVGKAVVNLLAGAAFAAAGVIDHSLVARQSSNLTIDQCPGYVASNVQYSGNKTVSADLSLAGTACNTYGTDLPNLKLLVEYQTSKPSVIMLIVFILTIHRSAFTCQDIRCCRASLSSARVCAASTTNRRRR